MRPSVWIPRYVGVFLLSMATLMFQVSYSRVLSVALWHHFVWMVVSIALLGYGASGTILNIFPKLRKLGADKALTVSSVLFSASILASYLILNNVPFDPSRLSWDTLQLVYIAVYYVVLSIPFILSGLTIAHSIQVSRRRIGKLYFCNLIGSAIGAVLVLPLFSPLTGPGVVTLSSLIAGASALAFAMNLERKLLYATSLWALIILFLLPQSANLLPIQISPYKTLNIALSYPGSELIETNWNPFSRVDVVKSGLVRYAPGFSLRSKEVVPEQIGAIIDDDALTAITMYDGDPSSLVFTGQLPSAVPFKLSPTSKILILGAGGGLDVLTALHHGSSEITAVEMNPIIVNLVKENYGDFSGRIYRDERVNVVVTEPRSFIQATDMRFDIIILPIPLSASVSSTGIYALSEDYLHTVESFQTILERLTDEGYFCASTWILPPPREDVRIVSLVAAALERLGVEDPSRHIAVIRSWGTITLLAGKTQLEMWEIDAIREFCNNLDFDIVYVPGVEASEVNIYNRFPEPIYFNLVQGMLHAEDKGEFYKSYLYDIRPVTDERPFFFHFFKWDRLLETYESLERKWQPLIEGGYLVPLALIQALLFSMLLIFVPLRFHVDNRVEEHWDFLAYFFCLGLGYMFFEMTAIQKFILVLGHPSYSISFVIFSLLLSSGLGSYASGRIEAGSRCHKILLLSVGLILPLYGLGLPVLKQILSIPLGFRILTAFFSIAPLGILLGMPFPLGIKMIEDSGEELVSWAWAVNGFASVLGSIIPTMLALSFGFSSILVFAGLTYLTSLVLFFKPWIIKK